MNNCTICKKICTDGPGDERSMICDLCEKHMHIKCERVTVDLYTAMKDPLNAGGCWFCRRCRDAALPLHRQMANLRLEQTAINQKIEGLETQKVNKEDLEDEIIKGIEGARAETKIKQIVEVNMNETKGTIRGMIKEELIEFDDADKRKNNIIMHGLTERTEDDPETAKKNECEAITQILQHVEPSFDEEKMEKFTRLGRKEDDKKRPILIQFDSLQNKNKVMKNLSKIKTSQWHRTISISHDMTQNQRKSRQELIEKAKEAAGQEKDLFLYKLVGQMGREKVIKIRKTAPIENLPPQAEVAENVQPQAAAAENLQHQAEADIQADQEQQGDQEIPLLEMEEI